MPAYVLIVRERTVNAEAMARYRDLAPRARVGRDMTPLAFYGAHEVLEGDAVEGIAILRFPSMAAAREWYESPLYAEARAHCLQGSQSRVYLVEGVPPVAA
jgi:uncharacterized protein (DUF1330 family)